MKLKKIIYIIASMFLGFLLLLIVHAWIEMWYIDSILSKGIAPQSGQCFLPKELQIMFPIAGLAFGYILGQRWWQIVYVEKRHWRKKNR